MPRRRVSYNVRPRYTGGSPAMVDERTARRVAESEQDSYEAALEGIYGPEYQERADSLGVRGIAEAVYETRKGWEVEDLITGERYLRPFDEKMRNSGWLTLQELEDWAKDRVQAELPHIARSAQRTIRDAPTWWFRSPRPWDSPIEVWRPEVRPCL
jgi:hypothetical protein